MDGSVVSSVQRQLHLVPPDASHLVISVGGNDALGHAGVLDQTTRSIADPFGSPRGHPGPFRTLAATGLTVLNDCITREAFARGLSLIDLRLICDGDEDFANPIEPSVRGGAKIAAAIAALVTGQGGTQPSKVFARVEDKP